MRDMNRLAVSRYQQNLTRRTFGALKAVCNMSSKQREVEELAYRIVQVGKCFRRW